MRIANWALIIALVLPVGVASAQQQEDSPAAAARRAQEQKKKNPPKSAKVWDNDNIQGKPGNVNVVGQTAAPGENAENPSAAEQEAAAPPTPEEKSALEGDVSTAKAQLESLKNDLDILQRKYALDQQTYYGKTGYASDKAGAAALEDEKSQLDAKQAEVAAAQKKLDDLQAKLGAAK
ncbi:MAG: hypothetical protein LAN36_02490 [Acidobacteriia bacterium]|nr:hypothetical protein [Terriglobia bacterium]